MNNHFSGKLNDMHCENYNVAFPLCEVYQDTFPVSPEIDDWPSTGGCPGTIFKHAWARGYFKTNGFNLEKAVSKLLVVSIQKTTSKVLMMLKRLVKIFHPWLGLLENNEYFDQNSSFLDKGNLKRSPCNIKNPPISTFCNCIIERTWTRCLDWCMGQRNFLYFIHIAYMI